LLDSLDLHFEILCYVRDSKDMRQECRRRLNFDQAYRLIFDQVR